jgi:hypothetical protein
LKRLPRQQPIETIGAPTNIWTPTRAWNGIEVFYEQCLARGAKVIKPFAERPEGTKDFYVKDREGYIVGFRGT